MVNGKEKKYAFNKCKSKCALGTIDLYASFSTEHLVRWVKVLKLHLNKRPEAQRFSKERYIQRGISVHARERGTSLVREGH